MTDSGQECIQTRSMQEKQLNTLSMHSSGLSMSKTTGMGMRLNNDKFVADLIISWSQSSLQAWFTGVPERKPG